MSAVQSNLNFQLSHLKRGFLHNIASRESLVGGSQEFAAYPAPSSSVAALWERMTLLTQEIEDWGLESHCMWQTVLLVNDISNKHWNRLGVDLSLSEVRCQKYSFS